MKKLKAALLLPVILSLFIVQCKKQAKDFVVYSPTPKSISFNDVTDLIIDSTGKTVDIKAKIGSKAGLQKVEVVYQPWNISTTITSFANPNAYSLDQAVLIPANAALQVHSIVIRATDKNGETNFTEVKIGLQDLNYNKLYLADVAGVNSLTSGLFGVSLVMDKISSFNYQLIYYARGDSMKVRFIPDKTTFTPVAIGKDPANPQKLITDGTQSVPLQLGAKGYYTINVNTLLLSYSVSGFTPSGTPADQVAIVGRGFYDFPNMNWQNTLPNIILLNKDSLNPFLFTKQIRLGIPPGQSYNSAQFIFTTNNGWTNYWRFDNATSPELAVFNGGVNADIPITATPVNYLFTFDSFTGRVQAIKQ